jgi:hypothetical protein
MGISEGSPVISASTDAAHTLSERKPGLLSKTLKTLKAGNAGIKLWRVVRPIELGLSLFVIPAYAGIQSLVENQWIPAFAGMTEG